MDRRDFLSGVGQAAVVGSAVAATGKGAGASESASSRAEPLPSITLGSHRISRLVVGSNPILGYSYMGHHTDRLMKEYFTVERAVEFLLACERAGIKMHQTSYSPRRTKVAQIVQRARERGTKLKFISLLGSRKHIDAAVAALQPIGLVHHGGVTDRLFAEGRSGEVHDFVKAVHDRGLLAGVSAHNPDCIRRIADAGWPVDFFMCCFYFLTRKFFHKPGEPVHEPELLYFSYPFYRHDPAKMTAVIREVQQPCFGFKILAAGRKCQSEASVREAFRYAFNNIKPTDGVIVGMFPRFFDEISANVGYVRQYGRLA